MKLHKHTDGPFIQMIVGIALSLEQMIDSSWDLQFCSKSFRIMCNINSFMQYVQTDTASVLMEAIGYIKFLQDQVEVLNYEYLATIEN